LAIEGNDGWLVIDKPLGMTSRAAVDHAARWFPRRTTIGHAGTLDPLATGVLVIAVGKATRLIEYVQDMAKAYTATFTFGATSATDDNEGPIEVVTDASDPGRDVIEAALATFIGTIEQTPPAFSAAKIDGQRAYAKARRGTPELPHAKLVRIDRIDVLEYSYPTLRVEIGCGKGTYIRSLARDLGAKLGCGGYVSALRRDAVGDFTPLKATSLDDPMPRLMTLAHGVVSLPKITLSDTDVCRFQMGQGIAAPNGCAVGTVACLDAGSRLVAIAVMLANQRLQPSKVFV
jgi:tRNA pseudouridine55 synthase